MEETSASKVGANIRQGCEFLHQCMTWSMTEENESTRVRRRSWLPAHTYRVAGCLQPFPKGEEL